jgi:sulfate adenylyltransferase
MSKLVPPHGGILKPLLAGYDRPPRAVLQEAKTFLRVPLTSKEVSDLVMLGIGAFSPLEGFMTRADYERVLKEMRLSTGVVWPIPVTVAVAEGIAEEIVEGQRVALVDAQDTVMAVMTVQDKFSYDKENEAHKVFGTMDRQHPGVQKIYDQGEFYIGGPVDVLSEGEYPTLYPEFARPAEVRKLFGEKGWSTVAAFQTRNPMHLSHEYLTKLALEVCDGLFIHPVVGKLKGDDIPAETRMKCYKALLDNYYPQDRVVLKVCPLEMRYGGPKEAILHAIIRQNFGCSHMIVGRDHAGVGNYYGPFDAQAIFDKLDPADLHLKPLKLDWTFWCYKCHSIASMKTCPHSQEDRLTISGTDLRKMLSEGKRPPREFSRPEVIDILMRHYRKIG